MKLVPDITNNLLEFVTQKFKTTDPIWRDDIIKIEIQKYRKFYKIVPYFYDNFTSFYLTKFNVKLQSYKFLSDLS